MKYVIITDAHWGYKNDVKLQKVLNFINYNVGTYDTLVCLGDMFDFWRCSIDDVFFMYKDSYRYLCENSIYIVGNHDYLLYKEFKSDFNDMKLEWKDKSTGFYFLHGFQPEVYACISPHVTLDEYLHYSYKMAFTDNKIGRFLSKIWGFYKGLTRHGSKRPPKRFIEIVDSAYKIYGNVIFGHLHYDISKLSTYSFDALFKGFIYVVDFKNEIIYKYNIITNEKTEKELNVY